MEEKIHFPDGALVPRDVVVGKNKRARQFRRSGTDGHESGGWEFANLSFPCRH